MLSPQFLNIGNPRRIKILLEGVLDAGALEKIEEELRSHCRKQYALALYHYRFAIKQQNRDWRQKVSRLYYASYIASSAIRLYIEGIHSKDVSGHKKVGTLPEDFPRNAYFKNNLDVLRVDRNTCDYNHAAVAVDLITKQNDSATFVKDFLEEVRVYLINNGLDVRGKP